MRIKSVLSAAAAVAMLAMPASALVMQSQSGILTKKGQRFDFDFTGLPTDARNTSIQIWSGPATTGSSADAGFDLDGRGRKGKWEFFGVYANGQRLGKYTCGARYGQVIAHQSMNGPADCQFKVSIDLDSDQFNSLLNNDTLSLIVKFGRGVGSFGDGDQLNVGLQYDEVVPAPLPATGLLLLGGIAAVGAAARRRKAKV